jgi:hypothetical protein
MSLETALKMAGEWGEQTLEELRIEAASASTGLAYSALRGPGGGRICVVVCMADFTQALGGVGLEFSDDCPVEDWSTLTLSEAALRALPSGFVFPIRSVNFPSALALIAADPDSITSMGELFVLPP